MYNLNLNNALYRVRQHVVQALRILRRHTFVSTHKQDNVISMDSVIN